MLPLMACVAYAATQSMRVWPIYAASCSVTESIERERKNLYSNEVHLVLRVNTYN